MRAMSAAELLDAWERGLAQPPLERALTLLAAAGGGEPSALTRLSIGQRDARLLALREQTFGRRLVGLSECPACGERLEMTCDVADLRTGEVPEGDETFTLAAGGYDVEFRLPDTLDLSKLPPDGSGEHLRSMLLDSCIVSARRGGDEVVVGRLPGEVLDAVEERMMQLDSQADVQLTLSCPHCSHAWQEAFDIGQFFWGELHAWAGRTLGEVHALARAYGWREADILSMSPARRQFYLGMVGG
jgi:hypothetical protein